MGVVHITSFVLTMVVITLTTVVADSGSVTPNAQLRGSKWTVHVYNEMFVKDVLLLHCKSKDDDLGEHKVPYNREYKWSFKMNFWRSTLFWCYFSSPYGHAEFDVFWPEKRSTWLETHCNGGDCVWTAMIDGIHLYNGSNQKLDYKHDWNTTTLQDDYGGFMASLLILK